MTPSIHPHLQPVELSVKRTVDEAARPVPFLPGELERRSRRLALIVGAHSSEVYPQIRNRDGVVVKWWVTNRGWFSEKGEAL